MFHLNDRFNPDNFKKFVEILEKNKDQLTVDRASDDRIHREAVIKTPLGNLYTIKKDESWISRLLGIKDEKDTAIIARNKSRVSSLVESYLIKHQKDFSDEDLTSLADLRSLITKNHFDTSLIKVIKFIELNIFSTSSPSIVEASLSKLSQKEYQDFWGIELPVEEQVEIEPKELNNYYFLQTDADLSQEEAAYFLQEIKNQLKEHEFSPHEWQKSARSLLVLLKYSEEKAAGLKEIIQDFCQTFFMQYYVSNQGKKALPEELYLLYQKIKDNKQLSIQISLYQRFKEKPVGINGSSITQFIQKKAEGVQKPFAYKLFKEKRPWVRSLKTSTEDPRSDSEMMRTLLKKKLKQNLTEIIAKTTKSAEFQTLLKDFSLILSYSMQKEEILNDEYKKQFQAIEPYLKDLFEKIKTEDIEESDAAKVEDESIQNGHQTFLELYNFYTISHFSKQLDRPGKLWRGGQPGRSSSFTLQNILEALNSIKKYFVQKLTKKRILFTQIPPKKLFLQEPFPDLSFGITEETSSQAYARKKIELLKKSFEASLESQIGFLSLEECSLAAKQSKIDPQFLERFEDGGERFITEYLYPYIVLKSALEKGATSSDQKYFKDYLGAKELFSLGETKKRGIEIVLRTIQVMFQEKSVLRGCPLQKNQLVMLQKFKAALEEKKSVNLFSDTGTGKSTITQIAGQILNLPVPYIVHISPFKVKVADLDIASLVKKKAEEEIQTHHLFLTTDELKRLLQEDRLDASFQNALFIHDEYDSRAYQTETATLQDFLFEKGMRHMLNMSATTNLFTLEQKIQRKKHKLSIYTEEKNPEKYKHLKQDIKRLSEKRDLLEREIQKSLEKEFVIQSIEESDEEIEGIDPQFDQIVTSNQDVCGSILVEYGDQKAPDFSKIQKSIESHCEKAALLKRSETGVLQAHLFSDHRWQTMELTEFERLLNKKMLFPLFCLYDKDSIGGDFSLFSQAESVKKQELIYTQEIPSTHTLFQNLRRIRGDSTSIPTTIHITPSMMDSLNQEELKQAFIDQAIVLQKAIEKKNEIKRLEKKLIRKKEKALKDILTIKAKEILDQQKIILQGIAGDDQELLESFILQAEADLEENIDQIIQKGLIFSQSLEKLKKVAFLRLQEKLTDINFTEDLKQENLETRRALEKIQEAFSQKDPLTYIYKQAKKALRGPCSYEDLWCYFLFEDLSKREDAQDLLNQLRGKKFREREYFKKEATTRFAPDLFKKFITGSIAKKISPFIRNIETELSLFTEQDRKRALYKQFSEKLVEAIQSIDTEVLDAEDATQTPFVEQTILYYEDIVKTLKEAA